MDGLWYDRVVEEVDFNALSSIINYIIHYDGFIHTVTESNNWRSTTTAITNKSITTITIITNISTIIYITFYHRSAIIDINIMRININVSILSYICTN